MKSIPNPEGRPSTKQERASRSVVLTLSNGLSLLRGPLALVFFCLPSVRTLVVVLAIVTDCCDGYLARRCRHTSRFGAVLDPMMDKLFVYVTLWVLFKEQGLSPWYVGAMLTRDVCLILFLGRLVIRRELHLLFVRSIRWGKITTATQFGFLLLLSSGYLLPGYLYLSFCFLGVMAFLELLARHAPPPSLLHSSRG